MQFISGANTITLPNPTYGYSVEINMALNFTDMIDAPPKSWDNGSSYDFRILRGGKIMQSATNGILSAAFLNDLTKGRGEQFTLSLGSTSTRFFPFGPDLGDVGNFTVQIIDRKGGGALKDPFRWFEQSLDLVLVSAPSYSVPTQTTEGSLGIGTITSLRPPQDGFSPSAHYGVDTITTGAGVPMVLDRGVAADWYDTSFDLDAGAQNMAQLLAYLTGSSGRNQTFTITTENNLYPFGADLETGGTFDCGLMSNVLTVTHDFYNHFTLPLNFWGRAA